MNYIRGGECLVSSCRVSEGAMKSNVFMAFI